MSKSTKEVAQVLANDTRLGRKWDRLFEQYATLQKKLAEIVDGIDQPDALFVHRATSSKRAQQIWEIDDTFRGAFGGRR